MQITIQYFASVREAMGKEQEQIELPDSLGGLGGSGKGECTVGDLISYLASINTEMQALIETHSKLLVAVNQTVVDIDRVISSEDEVAFFPPMTGG